MSERRIALLVLGLLVVAGIQMFPIGSPTAYPFQVTANYNALSTAGQIEAQLLRPFVPSGTGCGTVAVQDMNSANFRTSTGHPYILTLGDDAVGALTTTYTVTGSSSGTLFTVTMSRGNQPSIGGIHAGANAQLVTWGVDSTGIVVWGSVRFDAVGVDSISMTCTGDSFQSQWAPFPSVNPALGTLGEVATFLDAAHNCPASIAVPNCFGTLFDPNATIPFNPSIASFHNLALGNPTNGACGAGQGSLANANGILFQKSGAASPAGFGLANLSLIVTNLNAGTETKGVTFLLTKGLNNPTFGSVTSQWLEWVNTSYTVNTGATALAWTSAVYVDWLNQTFTFNDGSAGKVTWTASAFGGSNQTFDGVSDYYLFALGDPTIGVMGDVLWTGTGSANCQTGMNFYQWRNGVNTSAGASPLFERGWNIVVGQNPPPGPVTLTGVTQCNVSPFTNTLTWGPPSMGTASGFILTRVETWGASQSFVLGPSTFSFPDTATTNVRNYTVVATSVSGNSAPSNVVSLACPTQSFFGGGGSGGAIYGLPGTRAAIQSAFGMTSDQVDTLFSIMWIFAFMFLGALLGGMMGGWPTAGAGAMLGAGFGVFWDFAAALIQPWLLIFLGVMVVAVPLGIAMLKRSKR